VQVLGTAPLVLCLQLDELNDDSSIDGVRRCSSGGQRVQSMRTGSVPWAAMAHGWRDTQTGWLWIGNADYE
jgi:hypothetical protein